MLICPSKAETMTPSHVQTSVPTAENTMQQESISNAASMETKNNIQERASEQVTVGTMDNETPNAGTLIHGSPLAINVKLPPSSTSAASQSSSVKTISSPHPGHYLHRTDGTVTPLIAVDELPAFLHIVGVSRLLTKAQTQDMISLGTLPRSQKLYAVQMVDPQSEIGDDSASVRTIEIPAGSRASDVISIKGDRSRKESVKRWVQDVSQEDDTQVSCTHKSRYQTLLIYFSVCNRCCDCSQHTR